MNWSKRSFLPGVLAAAALALTATAYADAPFGYFDAQNQMEREQYHHNNPEPRYADPYYEHQRMQRQSDYVRRQQDNLNNNYHQDVQQFRQSHRYMRNHRRSSHY